ncbi:LOW QUALITY PROTEIN: tripartite motif-containing protein 75-like [Penaeus monodon]|uniref:LOW QUALITY PROTEIN: tripartite motif-containing protein 75-like n=1 Tax=Penaeus monodon TaxID=6687 RepID=UPI0018A73D45|nr:LOW QUALITY PROTEIN: tripartite motif-containing protein 75-like [Penaeus monodon]
MDCKVCYSNFDDKASCPRNLECGHSFCTSCLKAIHYGSALECPECRHEQSVEEVAALPVGFGVLRAVEAARGEISTRKEQDEWEAPLFILPRREKDLQEGGKESLENEGAADLEALKKSKIYFCAEKLEELKDYERVLGEVSANVRRHVNYLEKILQSRQSVIQSLQKERERCQREQESIEGRKKELFVRKEQLDDAPGGEETADFRPKEYLDRRRRLKKFLEINKEALGHLHSFASHICQGDKHLLKDGLSMDSPESDLVHLFSDMMRIK